MLVYLDTCCFSREVADQDVAKNVKNASDFRVLLALFHSGRLRFACSPWLIRELEDTEPPARRRKLRSLLPEVSAMSPQTSRLYGRAEELIALGIGKGDALHVAAAESVGAEVLLTFDDEFAELGRQFAMMMSVRVALAGDWLSEVFRE